MFGKSGKGLDLVLEISRFVLFAYGFDYGAACSDTQLGIEVA